VRSARRAGAEGDGRAAVAGFRAALALWRGPALGGTNAGGGLSAAARRLEESRLVAAEDCMAAELAGGAGTELVPELTALVAEHPLRERLCGQLMLALYRAGRQADALAAWWDVRGRLRDELGLDPGPELMALHDRVLRNDRSLLRDEAGPVRTSAAGTESPHVDVAAGRGAAVPRELPADVRGFVGRQAELAMLDGLLDRDDPGPVMRVVVIGGTAGVGKTALAVHWSHRIVERFPDGQLFADLRGYDRDRPLSPADVLAVFLRALGVDGSAVPADIDERAALYRSVLAHRRVLVVLDNADGYDHVRLLLPGGPACQVVVTSRERILALGVRHGAVRIELDLLSPNDSVALLARRAGDRVTVDPAGTAALAERCAYLPLALCIAAEYLVIHPAASVAALTAELADADRRLDLLDGEGDRHIAVRNVLSWSYRALPADVARAFRLLGTVVTAEVDRYAAAALLDTDARTAARLLDRLGRGHLLHEPVPGRYGMHDLLRGYAAEQSDDLDDAAGRDAHGRLAEHYLAAASAAMDVMVPHEKHRRPGVALPVWPIPALADQAAATAWLDANRTNLVGIAGYTADHGRPEVAVALAAVTWRYFDNGGYHPEAIRMHEIAVRAGDAAGDRMGVAHARRHLAITLSRLGQCRDAVSEIDQALAVFQAEGDRVAEAAAQSSLGSFLWQLSDGARAEECFTQAHEILAGQGEWAQAAVALSNLAGTLMLQGRYDEAITQSERVLATFIEIGDRVGTARTLGNLAEVYERLGRYPEAAEHYHRCLAGFRDIGSHLFEGRILGGIASVTARLGRPAEAIDTGAKALAVTREFGDREGEAMVLDVLGTAHRLAGRPDDAARYHARAVDLAVKIGDRDRAASALIGLAAAGAPDAATHLRAAVDIAREIRDRHLEARALDGMARWENATGSPEAARAHWSAALEIFTALRVPEADGVRAHLRDL
ncbi:MAG TPA: tetratricopeptide repeat protein, partial [Micromonosporaceae bacterium]|nr:tetratricopeptide repeat protein [Micromonosporaceae bacterium]